MTKMMQVRLEIMETKSNLEYKTESLITKWENMKPFLIWPLIDYMGTVWII